MIHPIDRESLVHYIPVLVYTHTLLISSIKCLRSVGKLASPAVYLLINISTTPELRRTLRRKLDWRGRRVRERVHWFCEYTMCKEGLACLEVHIASLEFLGCSLEHLHTELLRSAQLDWCFFALSGPLPLLSSLISQSVSCRISSIQPYKTA